MNDFLQMFVMIMIAVFVINLISSIYPGEGGKKTLTVAVSIITLYLCAMPFTDLSTYVDDTLKYIEESGQIPSDISYNYDEELTNALSEQTALQIENDLKTVLNVSADASVVLSSNETVKIESINIELTDNFNRRDEVAKRIYEKYKIEPTFS